MSLYVQLQSRCLQAQKKSLKDIEKIKKLNINIKTKIALISQIKQNLIDTNFTIKKLTQIYKYKSCKNVENLNNLKVALKDSQNQRDKLEELIEFNDLLIQQYNDKQTKKKSQLEEVTFDVQSMLELIKQKNAQIEQNILDKTSNSSPMTPNTKQNFFTNIFSKRKRNSTHITPFDLK